MLLTSKWLWLTVFLVMIIIVMLIGKFERKKKFEENSLDKTIASFSGMDDAPWRDENEKQNNEKELGKGAGKIKRFYSGKTSRRANLHRVIWTEKNIMRSRAVETAKIKKEEDSNS